MVNSRKFIIMKLIRKITNEESSWPVVLLELAVLKTITYETIPNIKIVTQMRNEENRMALVRR